MNSAFIYSFIIGFVGAALFLFVDKYERDGMVANLLKFWCLRCACAASAGAF
jgi:hypothetical protein